MTTKKQPNTHTRLQTRRGSLQRQQGFSLIEMSVVILVIAGLIAGVLWASKGVSDSSKVNRFTTEISTIAIQTRTWRGIDPRYTGVNFTALTTMGLLQATWGAGTGVNPAGGNYTVAANATDSTRFDLVATGMDQSMCLLIEKQIEGATSGGNQASCSAGTLTAVFQ